MKKNVDKRKEYIDGFNHAIEIAENIAWRRMNMWKLTLDPKIESPHQHLTVSGQIEVVYDEIHRMRKYDYGY